MELAGFRHIDEGIPFVVECDASETTLSATLNLIEIHYSFVDKEATAIIEVVQRWEHLLARQYFTIITDQRSVALMLDNRKRTKIKNNKIQGWRLELVSFSYTITYRPGVDNVIPDTLTRSLSKIHTGLCDPGVTRILHFVRLKNLPYSTEEVKKVCSSCRICAELKPHFHRPQCERYNGIVWKSVLARKAHSFPDPHREMDLPDALHSIRLLLSTSINTFFFLILTFVVSSCSFWHMC